MVGEDSTEAERQLGYFQLEETVVWTMMVWGWREMDICQANE